jgi:hypothetical protein
MQKKKKRVKREYSVKIFSFFLEKKLLDFGKKDWSVFHYIWISDFSLVTFFELLRPCRHSMPNPPSFGFALPKPSFIFKFFD